MDKLNELIKTGYRSLRNDAEELFIFRCEIFFGVKIQYQTIYNWYNNN